mgnify:CR=1 FL=1
MNSVSPINQKYIVAQSMQQVEKPAEQNQTEMKINKKVVVCSIAAAVGIIALASALIYKAKTGKIKGASEEGEKIVENIKQFLNKDNQLVEGVTLNNGRAINADNTMFSGIMNTVNKKGEQITLEFQEGFIVSSKRNGELFKKFENIANLTREQGVQITQYDKGSKKLQTLITKYDNGQVKRIYRDLNPTRNRQILDLSTAIEFTPSGKVAAKAEYNSMGTLQNAQIFDEDGRVRREIGMLYKLDGKTSYDGRYIEKEYRTDGTLKLKKYAFDSYYPVESTADNRIRMLSENKLHRPNKVYYYDNSGTNIQKIVSTSPKYQEQSIEFNDGISNYKLIDRIKWKSNNDPTRGIDILLNTDDDLIMPFKWDSEKGILTLSNGRRKGTKEQARQIIEKLEEAYNIVQEEGMAYYTGTDEGLTYIDVPNVIQQMKELISSL